MNSGDFQIVLRDCGTNFQIPEIKEFYGNISDQ